MAAGPEVSLVTFTSEPVPTMDFNHHFEVEGVLGQVYRRLARTITFVTGPITHSQVQGLGHRHQGLRHSAHCTQTLQLPLLVSLGLAPQSTLLPKVQMGSPTPPTHTHTPSPIPSLQSPASPLPHPPSAPRHSSTILQNLDLATASSPCILSFTFVFVLP